MAVGGIAAWMTHEKGKALLLAAVTFLSGFILLEILMTLIVRRRSEQADAYETEIENAEKEE